MRKRNKPLVSLVIHSDGTVLDPKKRSKMKRQMAKSVESAQRDVKRRSNEALQTARDNPALTAALSASALGLFFAGLSAGRRFS